MLLLTRIWHSPPGSCCLPLVVFCFALGCTGPPKHLTFSNATGAEQYERLMWETAHNRDWKAFEQRLAPAFVGVDGAGRAFDRSRWVDRWKNTSVREYSLGEFVVQPEGVDMVVSYLVSLGPGATPDGAQKESFRVVSVWQQVKSGWIQTASSMTPIQRE
jgi:hypothetical protein